MRVIVFYVGIPDTFNEPSTEVLLDRVINPDMFKGETIKLQPLLLNCKC